ncbi:MAG TPA: hypothetical protein VMT03_21160 [Polyangia bacterium]|nr:hypothetical protein [Polyangia bacterium]
MSASTKEAFEPRLKLPPADPNDAAPLPFDLVLMGAGINVAVRSLFRRLFGWRRHPGDAPEICRRVVDSCWTGEFFAGSAGHFKQFWMRDLAMCTPALCRLGRRDQVIQSLAWGLERFEKAGRITTTIFNRRFARDVYAFASDSLPMMLFALRMADAPHLIDRHRELLTRETTRYIEAVFDPELGMARPNGYFSGPRDCMTGRSTVFANTMIALLIKLLDVDRRLPNPLAGHDLPALLIRHYWTGDYFRDSLDRELPSGDANVWPFFFDVLDDAEMKRRAFATLESRGFTRPVPMRYFERRMPEAELPIPRFFTPNYQGDPSWTQLGPAYLHLLAKVDRPQMEEHRAAMTRLIERDGNYLELYNTDGKPYSGRAFFYQADQGMIWAAMFLDLYS